MPKINNKKNYFIPKEEGFDLKLIFHGEHNIKLNFHKNKNKKDRASIKIDPSEFIGIKGVDAIGKQLSRHKIKSIDIIKKKEVKKEIQKLNPKTTAQTLIKI